MKVTISRHVNILCFKIVKTVCKTVCSVCTVAPADSSQNKKMVVTQSVNFDGQINEKKLTKKLFYQVISLISSDYIQYYYIL
jgi:hypothetical protein